MVMVICLEIAIQYRPSKSLSIRRAGESCGLIGVTMSNYDSLIVRTVAFPVQVAYWIKRSWPPADTVSHANFDQWSGDMAVGPCGLWAILAWQGVSRARLQAQSSRKVGVRPLLTEPGPRLRHSWAAVTDHDVYAF